MNGIPANTAGFLSIPAAPSSDDYYPRGEAECGIYIFDEPKWPDPVADDETWLERSRVCKCPCHTRPGMLHIRECCHEGYVS